LLRPFPRLARRGPHYVATTVAQTLPIALILAPMGDGVREGSLPHGLEAVKNPKALGFSCCNPLRIRVGARHGVPLRGFFHSFLRPGLQSFARFAIL
jgi:hypothetical protein